MGRAADKGSGKNILAKVLGQFSSFFIGHTLPETNSEWISLKIYGWKMNFSLGFRPICRG